jgi:choice-of-anchor B domain-containing protein
MKLRKLFTCAFATAIIATSSLAQNLNVVLRSQLTYPGKTCANICGYVDSLGNEYALVGVADGMSIVDVTNPATPVEVKKIPNINNLWKEIKVYGKYAYVTTEGGGGLQIVNMSSLPNTAGVVYQTWTGDGAIAGSLNTIHALHIDGHFAYLYGTNLFNGGAIAVDLTDPWNPTYAGKYEVGVGNQAYVHDGYVRNDTMYAGHIYSGYFAVVDFTNKAAPVELAVQYTPNNFTHNTWLSQNSNVLFTTDEVDGSFLTSYDISNLSNIVELDRIQSNPGSQSIVHNTHIINVGGNDYAVTSWYKDGFTIVDAGRPNNLVQVGNYDTYAATGGGFEGTWGVYPYLPSGTIIVSNIEDGLFVFTPTYVRACYLEGMVTDSVTGLPINGATVQINTTTVSDNSNISGNYATGLPSPGGTYSVTYSKPGYVSKTITGISLSAGAVTIRNVVLAPLQTYAISGKVVKAGTSIAIPNANVSITNGTFSYQAITDASGNFSLTNVVPDYYEVSAGKWGYTTSCAHNQTINAATSTSSMIIELGTGYYDDFIFDFGWTVTGPASSGAWVRGIPVATFNGSAAANPGEDDSLDCGDIAFVTGNGGGSAGNDDVDNGHTYLISPVFDLTGYTDPYVTFSRWFYNGGGSGTPNDSMTVLISNGTASAGLDTARVVTAGNSTWVRKTFKISSYVSLTATMKLIVRIVDKTSGHVVEGGFDQFMITEGNMVGIDEKENDDYRISAYPNPFTSEITVAYEFSSAVSKAAVLKLSDISGRVIQAVPLNSSKGNITLNPSLSSGIYFVSISNGNEYLSPLKIVKMN